MVKAKATAEKAAKKAAEKAAKKAAKKAAAIMLKKQRKQLKQIAIDIKKHEHNLLKQEQKILKLKAYITELLSNLKELNQQHSYNISNVINVPDLIFSFLVTKILVSLDTIFVSNDIGVSDLNVATSFNKWIRGIHLHNKLVSFKVINGNVCYHGQLVQYQREGRMYGLCLVTNSDTKYCLIERQINESYREDFNQRNYV